MTSNNLIDDFEKVLHQPWLESWVELTAWGSDQTSNDKETDATLRNQRKHTMKQNEKEQMEANFPQMI